MTSLEAEGGGAPAAPLRLTKTITFAVTQPDYVAINEILVRPTDQTAP